MEKRFIILAVVVVSAFGNPNHRIYGGADAAQGAFPYMVSVQHPFGFHSCGGSIINANTVLTAHHCISSVTDSPHEIEIVAGSNKLNDGSGIRYKAKSLTIHPSVDIGLVILESPIEFTNDVVPIDLETETNDEKRECILSGWGETAYNTPNTLQFIVLNTLPNNECEKLSDIGEENLCTFTKKGEGACYGDSGSPLVAKGKQIAVLSRVVPCAVGRPDIYIRVSSFIDWIEENKA